MLIVVVVIPPQTAPWRFNEARTVLDRDRNKSWILPRVAGRRILTRLSMLNCYRLVGKQKYRRFHRLQSIFR